MTPKAVAELISPSALVDDVCFRFEGDSVRVFGAVAFVALGVDIKRRVEAENVGVVIGAEEQRLVEFAGLEFNALETLVLALGSARRNRVGAATAVTELEEANT
eukprot:2117008-Pleurochrysis_carterae.AAC.1